MADVPKDRSPIWDRRSGNSSGEEPLFIPMGPSRNAPKELAWSERERLLNEAHDSEPRLDDTGGGGGGDYRDDGGDYRDDEEPEDSQPYNYAQQTIHQPDYGPRPQVLYATRARGSLIWGTLKAIFIAAGVVVVATVAIVVYFTIKDRQGNQKTHDEIYNTTGSFPYPTPRGKVPGTNIRFILPERTQSVEAEVAVASPGVDVPVAEASVVEAPGAVPSHERVAHEPAGLEMSLPTLI